MEQKRWNKEKTNIQIVHLNSTTEWVYLYVELIHLDVHLKLTQYCKSTKLQKNFKNSNNMER